ncbi:exopolyphosphatase [Roseospira navarrensis]|uniref:Exopolyphosphatase n=1 Tax=Roseospira navarrensis TaxID=140058 RepID=A0A7X1ZEC0_9PROT|nr:exopolyphosphatase [Roseospira navarrensis]MQX36995.1 exopolyphosphatase [Roseospira navarrensis]
MSAGNGDDTGEIEAIGGQGPYRLVTRADLDGIISAVLLRERGLIGDVAFASPNAMQGGRVPVSDQDITSNLPYVEGVHLAFDHHVSEVTRVGARENLVNDPEAPSAARVIYNHYGGAEGFPGISEEMMAAVDQADSADYTEMDILAPDRWTMLNFVVDPRTGLHRFGDFEISNEQLMHDLTRYCRRHSIEEILRIPDVEARVHLYLEHKEKAEHQVRRCATRRGPLLVVDLREEPVLYPCNRFMIYALYPETTVSLTLARASRPGFTEIALGRSILNRASRTDVGTLLLDFGGGGHATAGTCQIEESRATEVAETLAARILADG